MDKKICGYCKVRFEAKVFWQRFCSRSCRLSSWWSKKLKDKKKIVASLIAILFVCHNAFASVDLDALVPKIIMAESSGDADAIGDNGKARGLMQIQEATWKRYSSFPWADAFNPEKNVQVGRKILEDINNTYQYHCSGSPFIYACESYEADAAHIIYSYNTGRYCYGPLPLWTKNHPNKIYREIFRGQ